MAYRISPRPPWHGFSTGVALAISLAVGVVPAAAQPAPADPYPAEPAAAEPPAATLPSRARVDVEAVQGLLAVQHLDGWLLTDASGQNPLAQELINPDGSPARRWFSTRCFTR